MITKFKAYAAAVGAAATGLLAILAPNTPAWYVATGVVAILVGLGVYQVPYQAKTKV